MEGEFCISRPKNVVIQFQPENIVSFYLNEFLLSGGTQIKREKLKFPILSVLFCICQFFSKIDNFKSYWTAISISEDKSSKVKENTKQQILDYTGVDLTWVNLLVNISLAGERKEERANRPLCSIS